MKNILKQFGVWDTSLKQNRFTWAVFSLTLSYVVGVFIILVISSVAIFIFAIAALPPLSTESLNGVEIEEPHTEFSAYEFRENLVNIIVTVDLVTLLIAALFAYFFARRTLLPIEELYRRQEQFVGDVAHELRTPLAVLKAGSQTVLRQTRSIPEYIEFISELEEETDRLTRLSNDLLFLLKNESAAIHPYTNFDLTAMAQKQVNNFQAYAKGKSIVLNFINSPQASIVGEYDGIVRVIQNLIKNAIDYNIQNGTVTVSVKVLGSRTELHVVDTGVGIKKESQPYIFDRFYKADSARTSNGTGLGLAIVRDIVLQHKGQISIDSTLSQGTRVIVSLPNA